MIAFIDANKDRFGVEPICQLLPIAHPPTYDARRRPPSARRRRDQELKVEIRRIYDEHFGIYGARKVWRQLHREGIAVARCTVERLMVELGLAGVRRGKPRKTTTSEPAAARPADLVERDFSASRPNQLWVADLTYVATWSGLSMSPWSSMPSAASSWVGRLPGRYEPTWPWTRWRWPSGPSWRPGGAGPSLGQGSQYLAIRYTERLAEAGAVTSVGSRGDSFDNALAETIIGLYKTELIRRRGPWKGLDRVEYATLEWVDWFNHRRLLEPIGHVPPAEFEATHHHREDPSRTTRLKHPSLR
jgi:putative transposase